jgi:hypothetical protein
MLLEASEFGGQCVLAALKGPEKGGCFDMGMGQWHWGCAGMLCCTLLRGGVLLCADCSVCYVAFLQWRSGVTWACCLAVHAVL